MESGRKIGEGAYGEVFKIGEGIVDEPSVIKVLQSSFASGGDEGRRWVGR